MGVFREKRLSVMIRGRGGWGENIDINLGQNNARATGDTAIVA